MHFEELLKSNTSLFVVRANVAVRNKLFEVSFPYIFAPLVTQACLCSCFNLKLDVKSC